MNGLNRNIEANSESTDEPKLHLTDLLSYLESSPLVGMYNLNLSEPPPDQATSKDIKNICKGLEKLLLEDLTYENLTALLVASSQTYLISRNFQDFECRTELLHKTFRYANTLDPVNLHIAAKHLHENIKSNTNLLFLCKNICFSSDMGNALSMCLLWAMLLEILGKKIQMYCFHPLSLFNELLGDVDVNEMVKVKETTAKAHFLIQLVAALVSSIFSRPNEEFKKAGYSQYFKYDSKDVHSLRDWAKNLNERITLSVDNSKTNYDLIMAIKETIAFNIMSPLEDKLKTIDGALDTFGIEYSVG